MVISEVKPKFDMYEQYDIVPPKNGNQKRLKMQSNREQESKPPNKRDPHRLVTKGKN